MNSDHAHAAAPDILLHSPRVYDLQVWLATRGRERTFRETILRSPASRPATPCWMSAAARERLPSRPSAIWDRRERLWASMPRGR